MNLTIKGTNLPRLQEGQTLIMYRNSHRIGHGEIIESRISKMTVDIIFNEQIDEKKGNITLGLESSTLNYYSDPIVFEIVKYYLAFNED